MEIRVERGGLVNDGFVVVIDGEGLSQSGVMDVVFKEPICLEGGRDVAIRDGA